LREWNSHRAVIRNQADIPILKYKSLAVPLLKNITKRVKND